MNSQKILSFRRASIAVNPSLLGAASSNAAATNSQMADMEESPETLQNIMRVTRDQESVFKVTSRICIGFNSI